MNAKNGHGWETYRNRYTDKELLEYIIEEELHVYDGKIVYMIERKTQKSLACVI